MCLDRRRSRTGVCALCTATAKQAYWFEFKTSPPRDAKHQAACVHVSTVADATSLPLLTFLSHVRVRLNNSCTTSRQCKLMAVRAEQSSSMINDKAKKSASAAKSHTMFQNKIIKVTETWENSKHVKYFRLFKITTLCFNYCFAHSWHSCNELHPLHHIVESLSSFLSARLLHPQCKKELYHISFLPLCHQAVQQHSMKTIS